jgi:spore maturation protein CgeB
MEIKKIYLFEHPSTQYDVLNVFTYELAQAIQRQGIQTQILMPDKQNPRPFLEQIFKDPPSCTLSFNGLLPDPEGRFFCDLIGIPHVCYLVDSPNRFLRLVQTKRNMIACIDQAFCRVFENFGFPHTLFLPHGVDRDLHPLKEEKPLYDVVLLASCIDYKAVYKNWKQKYSPVVCEVLEEAAEKTLLDSTASYIQSFVDCLDEKIKERASIDPHSIDYEEVLDDLEFYIRGRDRIELLRSVKEVDVHVFGSAEGTDGGWKKYIGDRPNIIIHPPVPYQQAIEIMKRSKILLNSTPTRGSHERIFSGLACGAAVITNESPFKISQMRKTFCFILLKDGIKFLPRCMSIYKTKKREKNSSEKAERKSCGSIHGINAPKLYCKHCLNF